MVVKFTSKISIKRGMRQNCYVLPSQLLTGVSETRKLDVMRCVLLNVWRLKVVMYLKHLGYVVMAYSLVQTVVCPSQ